MTAILLEQNGGLLKKLLSLFNRRISWLLSLKL
jgi:hypothetical protein